MMNIVRNSARPIRIWFDGISCVPSACLRKWKTMAIRVNEVIVTRIAGRNDISVSRRTICSGAETVPTPWMLTSTCGGRLRRWAQAGAAASSSTPA